MIPRTPLETQIIESTQFKELSPLVLERIRKILSLIDTLGDNPSLLGDLRLIALVHELPNPNEFGLKSYFTDIVGLLGIPRKAYQVSKKKPKVAEGMIYFVFTTLGSNVGVFFHFYWCWNKVRYKSNFDTMWFLDMLKKYKSHQ